MARTVAVKLPHWDADGYACDSPIPVAVTYERPTSYQAGGYLVEEAPEACPACDAVFTSAERECLAERAIEMAQDLDRERGR